MKKINVITVFGTKWFDKINGNTYHSCKVTVIFKNPKIKPLTIKLPENDKYKYGYSDAYLDTAFSWLKKKGIIKPEKYESGGSESMWKYCERNNITFVRSVVNVQRVKDLL